MDIKAMNAQNENKTVSVVIPSHNRSSMLCETLASVFAQEYRPIEVVVVDDGSTDDTKEAMDAIIRLWQGDKGIELRYIWQEQRGCPAARNRGWRASRGEFLQFLDSDDTVRPQKLGMQVKQLSCAPEVDVVCCGAQYCDGAMRPLEVCWQPEEGTPVEAIRFLVSHDVPVLAPLYRRSVVERAGGFLENVDIGEDVAFEWKVAIVGGRWRFFPDIMCDVRFHSDPNRMTSQMKFMTAEYETAFYRSIWEFAEAEGLCTQLLRDSIAIRLSNSAKAYYARGSIDWGKSCLSEAVRLRGNPRGMKERVYMLPLGWIAATATEASIRAWKRGSGFCARRARRLYKSFTGGYRKG
jgi:GT2 family glycosyltransferase